eukprot:GHVS01094397.1.p1 GENE.GHVS01094397.1~~GHVS01094397.1.p1  ORF type:complete len:204 (+),score=33.44 GHVS01094397.1:60-671(+)
MYLSLLVMLCLVAILSSVPTVVAAANETLTKLESDMTKDIKAMDKDLQDLFNNSPAYDDDGDNFTAIMERLKPVDDGFDKVKEDYGKLIGGYEETLTKSHETAEEWKLKFKQIRDVVEEEETMDQNSGIPPAKKLKTTPAEQLERIKDVLKTIPATTPATTLAEKFERIKDALKTIPAENLKQWKLHVQQIRDIVEGSKDGNN